MRRSAKCFDPAPLLRQMELTLPDLRTEVHPYVTRPVKDWQIAEALGVSTEAVRKWRQGLRRLKPRNADKYATRAGFHPCELWSDWYAS